MIQPITIIEGRGGQRSLNRKDLARIFRRSIGPRGLAKRAQAHEILLIGKIGHSPSQSVVLGCGVTQAFLESWPVLSEGGSFFEVLFMKFMSRFALVAASLMASAPAFAQEAAAQGSWGGEIRAIAAALAIGLAVLGGASAQGRAAAAANESIGRNPQSAEKLFTPLILGLALIEFQTIMAFIIAILLATK